MPAVGRTRSSAAAPAGSEAHFAHQPSHASARVSPALPAQLGVNPRRAVGLSASREDAADMAAQPGLRLGPVLKSGDRAQPTVEAAGARADRSAQLGHGMVAPLGR